MWVTEKKTRDGGLNDLPMAASPSPTMLTQEREREREREVRWKDIWIGIERDLKRDLDGVKVRDVRNFEKEEED